MILVGCVRTKNAVASAASELFASPLFAGRRRYAVASGLPWYILSAKFGLLAPDDVIGPYDVYLADQAPDYKRAWGEFVTAQLEQRERVLRGRTIEVHAGAAYVDPLRAPLAARSAMLVTPVAHLRQGEQLAWCHTSGAAGGSSVRTPSASPPMAVPQLTWPRCCRIPRGRSRLRNCSAAGPQGLLAPGLYSWWVDDQGAADLSGGHGYPVPGGLIYAGQAGATRWPSGKRSQNTLWGRITGMHLGWCRRVLYFPADPGRDPAPCAWP